MIKVLLILLFSNLLTAKEMTIEKISIVDAVKLAQKISFEVKEVESNIRLAESEIYNLKGQMRPKIELILGLGPHYKIDGDAISSTSQTDEIGISTFGKVEITAPIFGFGRGDNYLNALNGLKEKNILDVEIKKNEIAQKVEELYWGYISATNLNELAQSTFDDLSNALNKIDKNKNKNDFSKLLILKNSIANKILELEKLSKLTLIGFNLYLTGNSKIQYTPADEWIDIPDYPTKSLDEYLTMAQESRSELKQLNIGIKSKNQQLLGDQKGYYPTFALLAKYDYANSPLVADQKSHFAQDIYNRSDLSIGVGLVWKFDFGITKGKLEKTKSELSSLMYKNDYAKQAIEMDVTQSYYEYQEKLKKIDNSKSAYKEATKWLRRVSSSISIGLIKASELVESYEAHAIALGQYYQALYEAHIAYLKLLHKCK